ncbi:MULTISPECIES: DUF4376 domain-containing protein [unclassified Variovorax]|uniref:DUF4376 domain-containing protein n=1 Tax=unclassified Variovorax TaxID=663243 RepID=UPI00088750A8|nr:MULTISPECIES: DUF4376 domain-containing protein [unclassified Variovorax]SCX53058.1 protein of unknown function [Variovorax sp. EL159]SOD25255.1 protein of unknown function [Variovorax sp. YR752]
MNIKTVYSYDPQTRFYTGPVYLDDSDLSPLEPGVHLIPADCLEEAPPHIPEGFRASAEGTTWALVAIPAVAPPAPPSLDELRVTLTQKATARRWAVETGGITLPNGVKVLTGIDDQTRITSAIAGMEAEGYPSVDFKAASGWVELTLDELRALRGFVAGHVRACYSAERAHHTAIGAIATVAAAQGYDLTTGWPSPVITVSPSA